MKMQRISSHHLLISILIAAFFFLHACPSSSQPHASYYSDCAPARYVCGDATFPIGYPFRVDSRHDYCGYPNFYLSCPSNDSNTLAITIGNKNFHVTSIDYDNRLLHLVDPAFAGQSCPQPNHDTTVDPNLFRISDRSTNLTLFINCTAPSSWIPTMYDLMCMSFGSIGQHSYYRLDNGTVLNDDALGIRCSSTVVVPMDQDAATRMVNGELGFGAALQQGFSVNWLPGMDWCSSNCVSSGGRCGYNGSSPGDHTCFCSNGTFIDSCSSSNTRNPGNTHHDRWRTILGVCAAAGVASFIIGNLFITLWRPSSHKREAMDAESKREAMDAESVQAIIEKHGSLVLRSYTYSDVKKMTKSFSEKLGQGGYGTVFKGELFGGHLVAVKVLSESKGNGEDFINEVATIGQTSHVNVVTLRGFCVQGSKRALVYDFMPNGSLEKHISSEDTAAETTLGWEKLYEIVIGIARGLEYLHRGCNTRIVHFDIKPHNILLDQDLCPKISDFGMAKLCPGKGSIVSMEGTRGTVGYIAPEVFSRTFGTVSSKSDVYSYGMVLLEMFGGKRKRSSRLDGASDAYFPNWIYEHIDRNDNLIASYGVTSETEEIARKMMIVGFWCIQTMPENRPSMSRVVDMLEGSIKDLSIPPKPCLSSPVDLLVGSCATSST